MLNISSEKKDTFQGGPSSPFLRGYPRGICLCTLCTIHFTFSIGPGNIDALFAFLEIKPMKNKLTHPVKPQTLEYQLSRQSRVVSNMNLLVQTSRTYIVYNHTVLARTKR